MNRRDFFPALAGLPLLALLPKREPDPPAILDTTDDLAPIYQHAWDADGDHVSRMVSMGPFETGKWYSVTAKYDGADA